MVHSGRAGRAAGDAYASRRVHGRAAARRALAAHYCALRGITGTKDVSPARDFARGKSLLITGTVGLLLHQAAPKDTIFNHIKSSLAAACRCTLHCPTGQTQGGQGWLGITHRRSVSINLPDRIELYQSTQRPWR